MTSSLETETRNFWRAARGIRSMRRGLASVDDIEDCMVEIDGILIQTESPLLRARCGELSADMRGGAVASG